MTFCETCDKDVYPVQDMQCNHTLVDTCPDCAAALGPVDKRPLIIDPLSARYVGVKIEIGRSSQRPDA
jgi:hypothetical protein